ncbi:hypothetical protein [Bradyrhizobium japonicum]|uniref:hypothetical protein n=1 Tax=Bradyrhizobium japonicum TaxID=375 RepID=UPI001BA5C881|nr:hypothetical protein [Bradyrhizobium japonicum]MBR0913132.1 hypothetical protein [Bradyrhizobium japonicum]
MADKRIIDFPETTSPGADYFTVTDSASDGVRKLKPALPATATPLIEGTAAVGTSLKYAREDHVHPAAAGVNFVQAGTGAVTRTMQDKARDFVSILDFGAIGDGNIANAAVNATALTNALATGKTVFIPYTASGYHFGTNQITVGTGQRIVGESQVLLKSTATTSLFLLTGFDITSGIENISIDMTGSGSSSTAIRFHTSGANNVFRVRLSKIRFANCVEAIGDDGGSNGVTDVIIDDIFSWLTRGRQIHISASRGSLLLRSVIVDFTQNSSLVTYTGIQIDQFAGLELERVDVIGRGQGTPVYNSAVTGIVLGSLGAPNASQALWLSRVFSDSGVGDGILIQNTSYVFSYALESSLTTGNGLTLLSVSNGTFVNTLVNGAAGQTGAASGGAGLIVNASTDNTFHGLVFANCVGSGLNILASSRNCFEGLISTNNGFGLAVQTTSAKNIVSGGSLNGNTTAVSLTATGGGNVVKDIAGYNPVGASNPTAGASPWTYTAGFSPETLYIAAGGGTGSITQVTQGGVSILPQATANNGNFTIQLGPNEAAVITYTGTLVAKKMVH